MRRPHVKPILLLVAILGAVVPCIAQGPPGGNIALLVIDSESPTALYAGTVSVS